MNNDDDLRDQINELIRDEIQDVINDYVDLKEDSKKVESVLFQQIMTKN